VTREAIAAIRARAALACRLALENKQPDAKAALVQIASMLDADADRLESAERQELRSCDRARGPRWQGIDIVVQAEELTSALGRSWPKRVESGHSVRPQ
jgi:hypothetical protein